MIRAGGSPGRGGLAGQGGPLRLALAALLLSAAPLRAEAPLIGKPPSIGKAPLTAFPAREAVSPFAHLYNPEILHAPGSRSFGALRTDDAMVALIKAREKLSLRAFRGASGLWLIGYGHAGTARPGMRVTEREAERLLRLDLDRFEEAVKAALTRPVRQREFSAMVDLAYNAGTGAFLASSVLRRFNEGDRPGAADAFLSWNKYHRRGRLRVSRELSERRRLDRAHFLGWRAPAAR